MVEYQKLSITVASNNNLAIIVPWTFETPQCADNRIASHFQHGNFSVKQNNNARV